MVNYFFNDNFIEKVYKKFVKKNINNFYMEYILDFFFLIILVIFLNWNIKIGNVSYVEIFIYVCVCVGEGGGVCNMM